MVGIFVILIMRKKTIAAVQKKRLQNKNMGQIPEQIDLSAEVNPFCSLERLRIFNWDSIFYSNRIYLFILLPSGIKYMCDNNQK